MTLADTFDTCDVKICFFMLRFLRLSQMEEENGSTSEAVSMSGWLYKRGHIVKNIKHRWFELRGNELHYFESPEAAVYHSIGAEGF